MLLDTSGSNLNQKALNRALGAIESLFHHAYLQRQHCALVGFGNDQVTPLIKPQKAIKALSRQLSEVDAGGGTPLRRALEHSHKQLKHLQHRYGSQTLYILTDGKSTDELSDLSFDCAVYVIDTELEKIPLGRAKDLALRLGAEYRHLSLI